MSVTVVGTLLVRAVAVVLLAVLPVRIKTNQGLVVEGRLDGFTESSLLLDRSGEVVEYPFDDLSNMRSAEAEETTGPKIRVTLVGGSKIAAQDLSLSDSQLVVEPRRQSPIRVPVKQVKSIRFNAPSVTTDPTWLGIVQRESRGDTMVIRRPNDRLDPQQGIVVSIDSGKVGFDLDGDVIQAPIDRLEGVVFGGTRAVVEDADIQITDIYGSRWSAAGIETNNGKEPLGVRLSTSLVHNLPLEHIQSIQWSGGIILLADSKSASQSYQSYVPSNVDRKLLDSFFGPRRDGTADLLMFGGSSIEYRLEPGYRVFSGTIRRHDKITDAGRVKVSIQLDGETVWQEQFPDAQPRGFELPVKQSRRLAIIVDSGNDGPLGDCVKISRPRLLK